jgi:hypothetical protein
MVRTARNDEAADLTSEEGTQRDGVDRRGVDLLIPWLQVRVLPGRRRSAAFFGSFSAVTCGLHLGDLARLVDQRLLQT